MLELCNSEQKLVIKLKSCHCVYGWYMRDNFISLQDQLCPAVILVPKWSNSNLFTSALSHIGRVDSTGADQSAGTREMDLYRTGAS